MLKRVLYLFLFSVLVFQGNLFAQYDFTFSGYINQMPIYEKANDQLSSLFKIDSQLYLDLNRIRLRPTLNLWSGARVAMEYEIASLYYNSSTPLLTISNNKTNRQIIDLNWNLLNEKNFLINHYIDRLYFQQNFNFGSFSVGRQRIAWGTGRVWNPMDLFNPINPSAFYKIEKDGADVAAFKYFFGSFTDLDVVVNPMNKWGDSNGAFRFRTNYGEYDMSVMGGYFDKRIIAGADFAGNLFDAGVRGEGIISMNKSNIDSNFVKFILGMDYQFTSKFYGLIEYHFNGEGKANRFNYELSRLLNGQILNLSKNYLFIQGSYQLHPLISTSLSVNTNLNDGSGFTSALISYNAEENMYLNLGVQYFFGNDFTEYWYYPTSVYVQTEFYF